MKIIILGTAYPYRGGGIAALNERLATEYVKNGHDVEIVTFTLQYPNFLFPGKTQYSDDPAPEHLKITRRVNSCNPLNWIKVGREISKKSPDVLIIRYWIPFMAPCLGTIARIVRQNKHTHVISIVDNIIPHEHRIGDKIFSRYFVGSSDAFVAMSKSVLNELDFFDQKKPRLFCPHPIYDHYGEIISKDVAKLNLGLCENFNYVLFFGFIRAYKGLDLLLEAFADKRLVGLNVKLIVAGEFYGDSQPYLDQIERLGIADRIVLRTDFIAEAEVKNYFCASDIIAQPYKSATQSGVTQVAYHFEKPMLVTRVGGLPEIVPNGKAGYVVEPTANDIAEALVDYYQQGKEQLFIENVRKEKQKYAWSNLTDGIDSLLNDIGQ